MPWVKQVSLEESSGLLREQLEQAVARAGRIWNIVGVMSLNPEAMRDSIAFYATVMFGPSPLTRAQREMLATVVSAELDCFY